MAIHWINQLMMDGEKLCTEVARSGKLSYVMYGDGHCTWVASTDLKYPKPVIPTGDNEPIMLKRQAD